MIGTLAEGDCHGLRRKPRNDRLGEEIDKPEYEKFSENVLQVSL